MDMDIDDFRAMLYVIKQNRPEFELKVSAYCLRQQRTTLVALCDEL
jgi:hypothetical protein